MSNPEPVDGNCNYHPTQDGGYCAQTAGMGTDHLGEGHCKYHGGCAPGGARDGAGAPDGNTNSVTHGLYAEKNKFYQNVMDDDLRSLCDDIFEGYVEEYASRHGDPHTGHKSRLFGISVNHIKMIYSDNWMFDRPDELDSGNPMVDKETIYKTTADGDVVRQDNYKSSIVARTQQHLRKEDRAWLRDYGLLDDPESQKADAQSDLADAWRDALEPVTNSTEN